MNQARQIQSIRAPHHVKEQIAFSASYRHDTRGFVTFYQFEDGSCIEYKFGKVRAIDPMLKPVVRRPKDKAAARFIIADNPLLGELSDEFADFLYEAQEDFHKRYMEPTRDCGVDHRFFCMV